MAARGEGADYTCPSAPPEPGSTLLGVVARPGELAYLAPGPPVDDALLARLQSAGAAIENRFRFAGPCFEARCVQWSGGRCGLADRIVADIGARDAEVAPLPRCGIRATCRWYAQHRAEACRVCPQVLRKPGAG